MRIFLCSPAVSYSSHLEAFLSCSTSDNNTVILAWREKGKTHLRTTSLNITKGINGFDYDSGLNIIGMYRGSESLAVSEVTCLCQIIIQYVSVLFFCFY